MTTANSEDFDVKPPPPDGLTYNQDENYVKAHLDEDGDKYYKLEKDEIEFFSSQTGIKDPEELKKHILNVQREAYDVCDSFNRRLRYCATHRLTEVYLHA